MTVANSCRSTQTFQAAWKTLLPGFPERALLRACLLEGGESQSSWLELKKLVGDPQHWLENDHAGLKALLPFVGRMVEQNLLQARPEFVTRTRVAMLREELRQKEVQQVLVAVAELLQKSGFRALLLPGMATAKSAWPHPELRHNHALRLLVDDTAAVAAVLTSLNIRPLFYAPHSLWLQHPTGLAVELHDRLHGALGQPDDCEHAFLTAQSVADSPLAVPDRANQLISIIARAASGDGTLNLRWLVDAHALLCFRHHPGHSKTVGSTLWSEQEMARIVGWLAAAELTPFVSVLNQYLMQDFGVQLPVIEPRFERAEQRSRQRQLLYGALSQVNRRRLGANAIRAPIEKSRYLLWLANERLFDRNKRLPTQPGGAIAVGVSK